MYHSKSKFWSKYLKHTWKRYVFWAVAVLIAIGVVANMVMWFAYRGKVLPNVSLAAVPVGNIAYDDLDNKVNVSRLLPTQLTLTKDDRLQTIVPTKAGVVVDWQVTRERLKRQRSWFPLIHLVKHRTVPIELTVDQPVFETVQAKLAADFSKEPVQARIIFNGQDFASAPPEPGYNLDQPAFKSQVLASLKDGTSTLAVPTQVVQAEPPAGNLESDLQSLRQKLTTKIKFSLDGQITQPTAADIGGWFTSSGHTMAISSEKIESYISKLKTGLFNVGNAALAAKYALDKNTDTTIVLATTQASKYTYCAATKGVDNSHLPGFIAKVAAVLGDPRGWSGGAKVSFKQVANNCDFSLWLSAPSQMTSFGGLCDPYYSCRSGRNVVINFDRWQGATDPWNAAGGSLEDYRVMVTNHEVGHWLGFGHATCPGPGQPAPVMMQQSISLGGCKFNPWPVASEIAKVK